MAAHHIAAHHTGAAHKLHLMEKKEESRIQSERTTTRRAVDVLANNSGTFLMGLLHGRKGGMPETYGVPWDIGFGLLTMALGFGASKWLKGAADPIIALGSGFTGYFSGSMGAMLGQSMRKNAGEFTGVAFTDDQAKAAGVQVRTVVAGPVAGAPQFGVPYPPGYYAQPVANPMWNFSHYGFAA